MTTVCRVTRHVGGISDRWRLWQLLLTSKRQHRIYQVL